MSEYGDFKICGLVGIAGQVSIKHERAFKTLLILDNLRGVDSAGAVVVHRDGSFDTPKAVGNSFNLLESRLFNESMRGNHSALIGHNRWATQGKVNVRNAHPFEFDKVVGAHNGTLKNKYTLDKGHSFDVDSEALYHHINEKGVEDAIKNLDGAWALTWYDIEEGTINFLRNKERPLWMTVLKDGQLAWASESWMLEVALSREELQFTDPEQLPVDQWHKIQLFKDGTLGKPHVVPLASRFQPYIATTGQGHWKNGMYYTGSQTNTAGTQATGKGDVSDVQTSSSGTVIDSTKIEESTDQTFPYGKNVEVKMFVYGMANDTSGGQYYMCRDVSLPKANIRLYINQKDKVDLLNKHIYAKMHTFQVRDRYGLYYKVEHSTVRLEKPSISEVTKEVVETVKEEAESTDRFYQDSSGKLISQKDWYKKHGTCGWCNGHVNPNFTFKFTTSGDAICHECVDDREVSAYVNFAN